ncbi:MAG: DEAD/DEAH box helicase family protein, partial [Chloroflexi bacterium]|nr:DEAD/DEAH box helicase family protein [Chloroflexota bacterium]
MPLSEADTRAKFIDPAIHARGWTENLIRREETAGTIEIVAGTPRKQAKGRVDYTLRVISAAGSQPVAVALIEAKAEHYPATHGLQQGKLYASTKRLNVPFVYSTNGHQFVEYDAFTGLTHAPRPMSEFPTPDDLKQRYEAGKGFSLDSEDARALVTPYAKGETGRRYYQDAAIRAVLEKIATGGKRALLSLATGSGKTFIAVNLLKRISDAGQLRRALFICDRDELRRQGLTAFQHEFGNDAAAVSTNNPQKNARVVVATYQTLGVDREDADASFLKEHYPENYFSHIIIDECHRSAWGKWSEVLTRNADAVQIGLTATPREFEYTEDSPATREDRQVSSDNHRYFGEPVYEYSMGQGIEDGWLAAMEIIRSDIFLNRQSEDERRTGITQSDLEGKDIRDADTGAPVLIADTRSRYDASS